MVKSSTELETLQKNEEKLLSKLYKDTLASLMDHVMFGKQHARELRNSSNSSTVASFCNDGIQETSQSPFCQAEWTNPTARPSILQCKVAFSLLDSAIMYLRGAQSSFQRPAHDTSMHDQPHHE